MSKIIESFAKNTLLLTLSRVLYFIINFAVNAIITRNFGAETYGIFVLAYSTLGMMTIIIVLGNRNGLMYYLPRFSLDKQKTRHKNLIFSTILFSLLFGLFGVFIVFIFANNISFLLFNSYEYVLLIRTVSIIIYIESLIEVCKITLRCNNLIKQFALGEILLIISRLLLLLILIKSQIGVFVIVVIYIGSSLSSIFFYLYILVRNNLLGIINRTSIKDYFLMTKHFSPSLLNSIIRLIEHRIDKFMIGILISSLAVGIYNISLTIANLSSFLLIIINVVITPLITKLYYRNNIDELESLFKKSTLLCSIFNLIFFSLIILFGKEILLIFGKEFSTGYIVLIFISIGQVINSATGSVAAIINMSGKPLIILLINIISIIINILLNILIIPIYGIEGAAIATMMTIIISNISFLIYVYVKLKIHPFSRDLFLEFGFILLSIIFSLLVSNFISVNYIPRLILTGLTFLFTFIILNIVTGFHIKIFKSLKKLLKNRIL
jgi:O-antigen/teichoic acid export membrane protein